jgi:hypothetical protein
VHQPAGDLHGGHLRVDSYIGVADPPSGAGPRIGLVIVIQDAASATDDDDLSVATLHCVRSQPEMARQDRGPVGQQVLIAGRAATSKQRPLPIAIDEDVRLFPDAADAPPGEHRRRHIAGDIDRHRREATAAAQPPDGLQAS